MRKLDLYNRNFLNVLNIYLKPTSRGLMHAFFTAKIRGEENLHFRKLPFHPPKGWGHIWSSDNWLPNPYKMNGIQS